LRIAFISFEFPPDTGGGGIGTYLQDVIPALAHRSHQVGLFCGGLRDERVQDGNILIRKLAGRQEEFGRRAAAAFGEEHQCAPFQIIEVTDYTAWGLEVQKRFPEIPSVVKLHTPSFVIDQLHWHKPSALQRIRMSLGAIRRGKTLPKFEFYFGKNHEREIQSLKLATAVAATTRAVLERVATDVPEIRIKSEIYPYPFQPLPMLLNHQIPGNFSRVTYVGRLEPRKGVLDLARAIPMVRKQLPSLQFRFIGRDMPSSRGKRSCAEEIRKITRGDSRVEILPAQTTEEVYRKYGEADICCFPSHWESFGLVVLEAMAAGRAVIVAKGSGMAEIVEEKKTGLLVEPHNPEELAAAICRLAKDKELRSSLGEAARAKVLASYSHVAVLSQQITQYKKVMNGENMI
jgi:glycosyltransferase involved in cell wall biosynthesis